MYCVLHPTRFVKLRNGAIVLRCPLRAVPCALGSYHHLSVKHLDAYLDEMAFRYNNRENAYLFRDTLMKLIGADGMTYQELIQTAS